MCAAGPRDWVHRGTQQCDFLSTTSAPGGTRLPFRPRDDLICPTAQSQGRISSKAPGIRFLVPTPSYFPPLGFNRIQMWNSASDTRVRARACAQTHTHSHTFSFSHSSSSQANVCGPALLKPWACGDLHHKNTVALNLVQITLLLSLLFLIFLTFCLLLALPPPFWPPQCIGSNLKCCSHFFIVLFQPKPTGSQLLLQKAY